MIDPDVQDVFDEAQAGRQPPGRRHTLSRDVDADKAARKRTLSWAEERDRALGENLGGKIAAIIRKAYEMAEEGHVDVMKTLWERDFGKVSTPIEIDTSDLSTDQKIAALGALTVPEG